MVRQQVRYVGQVQGVGFRWTARRVAGQYAIGGYVRNMADGSVELVAEGEADEVNHFLLTIQERLGEYIRRAEVTQASSPSPSPAGRSGIFEIR